MKILYKISLPRELSQSLFQPRNQSLLVMDLRHPITGLQCLQENGNKTSKISNKGREPLQKVNFISQMEVQPLQEILGNLLQRIISDLGLAVHLDSVDPLLQR